MPSKSAKSRPAAPQVTPDPRSRAGLQSKRTSPIAKQRLRKLAHKIEYAPLDSVHPSEHNPRFHDEKQIKLICESINKFDFMNPCLVDAKGRIIAGHGRYEAARRLGLASIPIIRITHLTEAELRTYMVLDNRSGELSTWDQEKLALVFEDILQLDDSLEITYTGFQMVEVDKALQVRLQDKPSDREDETPDPAPLPVSRLGNVWRAGDHFVLCGDARDAAAYRQLLGRIKIRQVVTDPPYNVRIDGHVSGLGKNRHREFAVGSGEMSSEEFGGFLEDVFRNIANVCAAGCLIFTFIDWRHLLEILTAGHAVFSELKHFAVWGKNNGGMGSLYRSQHELIPVWKHGKAPHINNVMLGSRRYRTNLWMYDGVNTFKRGRDEELAMHPTVKPVAMIADALLDCSNRGDPVLDPFAGSGTILIAAEKTGRRAYAMDLDPRYCDVAIRRWQKFTGKQAVLVENGKTFDEIAVACHE